MKGIFSRLNGHEQVIFGNDPETEMQCIIAIYSTALGPALGGTRFYPYSDEQDALVDCLRLSKAMAYKAACAGLDLGGGKAVIIGDPARDKSEALLRAYGRIVESLNGRYVTACDLGTYPSDMAIVRRETRWATGSDPVEGGAGDSGILTAYGTYIAIKACAEERWGSPDLRGRHVAIQGCGKVGHRLAEHLHAEGAKLTVSDIKEEAAAQCAERFGAEITQPEKAHAVDADVFSPNALGAIINDDTIPELRCAVVAGAANNQLAEDRHGVALANAGILYAPDYVVSAGGIIQVGDELHPGGYSEARARARTAATRERLLEVFARSRRERISTAEAADRIAEHRMASVSRLRG
ncbi:MAG: Leu/Phe/Val dehydrogenase, partial [Egibacteraceae bacterium]